MPALRQAHGELGELADFALDRDRAAVLQGYDLIADRQAKPGALAGRLGGEERLKQLLPVFRSDADPVVAHANLDSIIDLASRDFQDRTVTAVTLAVTLVGGIEAIADEVQEHPHHVLRHDLDGGEIAVEIALEGDVKALILGAGAVICQVQGLIDERVDISALPVA